jgi:hypothetical protein
MKALSAAVCAMLMAASVAMSADLNLHLAVRETGGVARHAEPACGGIPLPWGVYKQNQKFDVLMGQHTLPAQVLPLVVDENGFLRWVLVDTQVDVPANGKVALTLVSASGAAKEATPLKITQAAGGVAVDTGRISFTINRDAPFSLFTTVQAGNKRVAGGGLVSYTDATDESNVKTYQAGAPERIEVYDAGPMPAALSATTRPACGTSPGSPAGRGRARCTSSTSWPTATPTSRRSG